MRVVSDGAKHSISLLLGLGILLSSLAGCASITGVGAAEPMAQMRVYPEEIEAGESITCSRAWTMEVLFIFFSESKKILMTVLLKISSWRA